MDPDSRRDMNLTAMVSGLEAAAVGDHDRVATATGVRPGTASASRNSASP